MSTISKQLLEDIAECMDNKYLITKSLANCDSIFDAQIYIAICENLINQLNGNVIKNILLQPRKISSGLAEFLGVNENCQFSRSHINKIICDYIKNHNLQKEDNKKIFVPDAKLKKLLKNDNEEVSFFNLQKFLKDHFIKEEQPPKL